MARELIADGLWSLVEPFMQQRPPRRKGGRPPIENRRALTGIAFVLKTGIAWQDLPKEMGCGCGMTCWRRLRDWQEGGIWEKIHQCLLSELRRADRLDLSKAIVDSSSVRAVFGGTRLARTRPIAGKAVPNTTLSLLARAYPSPPASPRRTAVM